MLGGRAIVRDTNENQLREMRGEIRPEKTSANNNKEAIMTKKKKIEAPHWRVRYSAGTLSNPMLKAQAIDKARRWGAKSIANNITGEVEMIDTPKKATPKSAENK